VRTALKRSPGLRAFSIVWLGQLVSLLGTGMTSFALSVWAWQETGSATAMSLLLLFAIGPAIVLGPIAGAMTLLVFIPQPEATSEGIAARGLLWSESIYGFRYILVRRGLLGLQLVFLVVNLAGVFQWALQSPMILARTGQDSRALGTVLSAA
jgi:hypothetical protein